MDNQIRNTFIAAAVGLGLLAASTAPGGAQTPNAGGNTAPGNPAADENKTPSGTLEKYHGQLRASELNGANVYNDQGTTIGTINDMLISDDGKVQTVVISVGGFLGIGTHYVAVPFSQLQVQPSRSGNTAVTSNNSAAPTGVATSTPASPMTAPGTPGAGMTPPEATTVPATGAAGSIANGRDGAAPATQYFSIVLPGATKDSLTKMPEFRYRG